MNEGYAQEVKDQKAFLLLEKAYFEEETNLLDHRELNKILPLLDEENFNIITLLFFHCSCLIKNALYK